MTLLAYNLLLEEFPMAEKYVRKSHNGWTFEGDVAMMEGVGRFVIGLAAEVHIIDSPELSEYVNQYFLKYVSQQQNK